MGRAEAELIPTAGLDFKSKPGDDKQTTSITCR